MSALSRTLSVPVLARFACLALCAFLFAACNESTAGPGEDGDGDFEVAVGVRYADTLYTPNSTVYQGGAQGFRVSGLVLRYHVGDSTVGTIGFLEVTVGMAAPVSGTYPLAEYTTGNPVEGKVQLYTWGTPGGMSWTGEGASGIVKVVALTDSVQVIGKNITLENGKRVSFNLKAARGP